jgi:MraZ protein
MFLGTFYTKFSGFGRVILPKKIRQVLTIYEEVVLARGLDGCIWGFDKGDFARQMQEPLSIPLTEEKGRKVRRYLFSGAELVSVDGQGRVVIPGNLLEYAGLDQEITVIGAGDHFEIWDPKQWAQALIQAEVK